MTIEDKYFRDPHNPERVMCIRGCNPQQEFIAKFCGFLEITPTFVSPIDMAKLNSQPQ